MGNIVTSNQAKLFDCIKSNFCLGSNYTLRPRTELSAKKLISTEDLCLVLSIQQCAYSFMYNGKRPVGAGLMIKIHELTGLSIANIKSMVD